jgi:hypothetical protein
LLLAVSGGVGLLGAAILLATPSVVFSGVLPWLMLFATGVFIFGNFAPKRFLLRVTIGTRGVLAAQFAIAIWRPFRGRHRLHDARGA